MNQQLTVTKRDGRKENIDLDKINFGIPETFATDESGRGFLIIASLASVFALVPGIRNLKEVIIGLEPTNE